MPRGYPNKKKRKSPANGAVVKKPWRQSAGTRPETDVDRLANAVTKLAGAIEKHAEIRSSDISFEQFVSGIMTFAVPHLGIVEPTKPDLKTVPSTPTRTPLPFTTSPSTGGPQIEPPPTNTVPIESPPINAPPLNTEDHT